MTTSVKVRMPDGTVMTVPQGTPKEQVYAAWKEQSQKALDPSAGGGTLSVGPFDTGIKTPQWLDRTLAGAGKAFYDVGRGVGQIAGQVSGEDVAASRALDAPLMRTDAGVAGNVLGNVAMTAPFALAPALGGVYGSAAVGGALGASQPVTQDESRAANIGIGALAGGGTAAAMKGIGRAIQPIRSVPGGVDARAINTLRQNNVPLDAAQVSGSPTLNRIKSALKDNPLTLGGQVKVAEQQQSAFNRAVLQSIGVNADAADEAVMGQAKARIGQVFNDVLGRTSIKVTPAELTKAKVIEAQSRRVLGDDKRITNVLADISNHMKQNGGKMDGRFYQTIRGDLATLETQPNISPIARELRETLDSAFQRGATPDDGKALQEARRQWRNMRIIESAVDTEGAGNISAAKLANQFGTKRNRNVGVYGQGDRSIVELSRLAKAGKRLLPDKLPQSGTAPRAVMQAALPAAAGAVYGGATQGDWKGAAMYAAGGAMAPIALQRLINSPGGQRYFTQGLAPEVRAAIPQSVRNALMLPEAAAKVGLPAYLLAPSTQ